MPHINIYTFQELFSVVAIFLSGMILCLFLRRKFQLSARRALLLYAWHTLFCIVYIWFVSKNGGDAISYYRWSMDFDWRFSFGTRGVVFITALLTHGLGLSFVGVSLFFNIVGAVGLLAFDGALKNVVSFKSKGVRLLASIIVLLPSVSFWSAGLGKDALSFCAMGLVLWASLNFKQYWKLLIISMLIMLLVRPHMAGIMGLALAGSFFLQAKISIAQRLLMGSIALAASMILVPYGLSYAGIGEGADVEAVMNYIEGRQSQNLDGGSSVDIAGMSLPAQLFTYLFRPTAFEAKNVFFLAAALDNTILLLLFVFGGWALINKPLPGHLLNQNRIFLWMYSLGAWFVLAMTTANLGIALRQKWMFAPMLIILLISLVGKNPGLGGRNDLVVR